MKKLILSFFMLLVLPCTVWADELPDFTKLKLFAPQALILDELAGGEYNEISSGEFVIKYAYGAEAVCIFHNAELYEFYFKLRHAGPGEIPVCVERFRKILEDLTVAYGTPTYMEKDWDRPWDNKYLTEVTWDGVQIDGHAQLVALVMCIDKGHPVIELTIVLFDA